MSIKNMKKKKSRMGMNLLSSPKHCLVKKLRCIIDYLHDLVICKIHMIGYEDMAMTLSMKKCCTKQANKQTKNKIT